MVQNRETVTTKELAHSLLNAVLFRTKLSDVEQQQAFNDMERGAASLRQMSFLKY